MLASRSFGSFPAKVFSGRLSITVCTQSLSLRTYLVILVKDRLEPIDSPGPPIRKGRVDAVSRCLILVPQNGLRIIPDIQHFLLLASLPRGNLLNILQNSGLNLPRTSPPEPHPVALGDTSCLTWSKDASLILVVHPAFADRFHSWRIFF